MKNVIIFSIILYFTQVNVFCQEYFQYNSFENFIYHAVGIPDNYLEQVSVDGNSSDWDWVPDKYRIRLDELRKVQGSLLNEKDFSAEVILGWSWTSNRLYFVIRVQDDYLSFQKSHSKLSHKENDNFMFAIDPANKGGEFNRKDSVGHVKIADFCIPVDKGTIILQALVGPKWIYEKSKYANRECLIKENKTDGVNVITCEIEICLWDEWNSEGEEHSVRHQLEENQIIGLAFCITDYDEQKEVMTPGNEATIWVTGVDEESKWLKNASWLPKFILDPPDQEDPIWNILK